jgi:xanthine dehydrogenase accessory factor
MTTLPLPANVHEAIVTAIDTGRPFAVAIVLKSTGSVPREVATKAIIESDGMIHGTIGGGLLEAEAQRLAAEAMRAGRPSVFELKFSGASAALNEPVCGGTMRVLVDPAMAAHRPAYAQAAEAVRQRRRGVLLTTLARSDATRVCAQWLEAETISDSQNGDRASAAIRSALTTGAAQYFEWHTPEMNEVAVGLAEPVIPQARLLVAGGGHVGQALAAQASLVGFEVIVVEDRAEFADEGRYPPGVTARCGQFADVLEEFPIDSNTYVAIVGRGHLVDMKALAACIDSPAAYIGMMGSRRKVALVRKAFLESRQATAEQFARVYAPIGLNLGAETVPEIAASIVAQLVAVRRTGSAPQFASTSSSSIEKTEERHT